MKLQKDQTNLDTETNTGNVNVSVESRDDEFTETPESKSDDDNLLEKKAEFYYCPFCSYETKTQWQFQLHEFTTHAPYKSSDDAKFKCKDCEFETNYRYNFRRHIERIHNYSEEAYFKVHYKSKIKEENTDGQIVNKKKLDKNKNKYDNIDMKEVEYEVSGSLDCPVCYRDYSDKYTLAWHLYKVHRDDSKILKWLLKCSLCNYNTYSRKNAYTHGNIHRGVEETTVKFKKYYNGVLKGSLKLNYGKGHNFKCSKCDYVTNTWDNFRKHDTDNHFWKRKIRMGSENIINDHENSDEKEQNEYIKLAGDPDNEEEINQNKDDVHENENNYDKDDVNDNENYYNEDDGNDNENQYNKGDVNENENCYNEDNVNDNESCYPEDDGHGNENHSQDIMVIPNNCMSPDCQYITGNMSHLKRHCLEVHKYKKEQVNGYFSQLKLFKCRKCGIETRYRKVLRDHLKRCKKLNVCKRDYTKDQINNIIGFDTAKIKNEEERAEENVEEVENALKIQENDEVITIKIIPDQKINEKNEDQSNLNPFTGELTMKIGDADQLSNSGATKKSPKLNFRCNRVGCKFSCETLKEVTNHIKSCTHESSHKNTYKNTKFTCHLCKKVLSNRNNLQIHCNTHADKQNNPELIVTFSEVTNDKHKCDVEIKADLSAREERIVSVRNVEKNKIPEVKKKVSYKCWMCGVLIFTRTTLWSHANLHAREDGNPKLKVRYSKFLGDKSENTLIVQADPNYVFRKKNRGRERSAELGYDLNLPVFSCAECNFKTNQEGALKKHKSLHWTPEKEVLFKAGKFFTCSICFFHCFDVETFKQHSEWHKTHYTATGSIRKLGKNSWFLK